MAILTLHRFPDLDLLVLAAPFERLFVGGEEEVDVFAFDGPADILDAAPAIAGNVHDGAEGVVARVGGDRAPAGFGAGGSDANGFGLAFGRPVGDDGLELPVALPAAALAAFAVAGGFHGDDLRAAVCYGVAPARGTSAQHRGQQD